jgi:hypothetical protein
VSLVELGVPPAEPRAVRAVQGVLAWLLSPQHVRGVPVIEGRARRCASQEGNALAVCCRLGLAGDSRVRSLADALVAWQWPDGGWNCDRRLAAWHSSFHESLAPVWGLLEYHAATGESRYRAAADRTIEMFLDHRLFRASRSGAVIDPEWVRLHYPPYWHYDYLQALLILSRAGPLVDPRLGEALDRLEAARHPDGTWAADAWWWRPPGRAGSGVEAVSWDRRGPNKMLTLNGLRVLRAAGRLGGVGAP